MPNVPLQYAPWFWKATGAGTDADPLVPSVNIAGTAGGTAGDVAHNEVDSGNPVKVGGKASSSAPTAVATGDRVDQWFGVHGHVIIGISSSAPGDGASAGGILDQNGSTRVPPAMMYGTNTSTADRWHTNYEQTALASAARTASVNSSDLTNYNAKGVTVVIDVTAASATPSVVFTIVGKCTLSGKYIAILASAAITGTGTTRLVVYPGSTVAANLVSDLPLPRVWRVEAVHADSDSITYSVSVNYHE